MEKKDFIRRVSIRMSANENKGNGISNRLKVYHYNSEIDELVSELENKLVLAEMNSFTNLFIIIDDNNKIKWFIKSSLRRILFILFGWLLFPIVQSENIYRDEMTNSIKLLHGITMELENILKSQEQELEMLRKKDKNKDT